MSIEPTSLTVKVEFDWYEKTLLRKVRKLMIEQAKSKGHSPPSMAEIVRGAVRTMIHQVYGETLVYDELLDSGLFQELMEDADMGPNDV